MKKQDRIYSSISSHIVDEDGYELEDSLLIDPADLVEGERKIQEWTDKYESIYNPVKMKMEIVEKGHIPTEISEYMAKIGAKGGAKSKGGGRPRKFTSEKERIDFHNTEKKRKRKADREER